MAGRSKIETNKRELSYSHRVHAKRRADTVLYSGTIESCNILNIYVKLSHMKIQFKKTLFLWSDAERGRAGDKKDSEKDKENNRNGKRRIEQNREPM